MLIQLALGAAATGATVGVTAGFIALATRALKRRKVGAMPPSQWFGSAAVLAATTLWLLTALTLSVFLWASVYLAVGAFDAFEPALYFAFAAFTTLGFGDVLLPNAWRLTAGVCAANGLLLFGVCTAFLVEVFRALLGPSEGSDG